jgi:hypothetical protein
VKVNEKLPAERGWHDHPKDTVADEATADQLARDDLPLTSKETA